MYPRTCRKGINAQSVATSLEEGAKEGLGQSVPNQKPAEVPVAKYLHKRHRFPSVELVAALLGLLLVGCWLLVIVLR